MTVRDGSEGKRRKGAADRQTPERQRAGTLGTNASTRAEETSREALNWKSCRSDWTDSVEFCISLDVEWVRTKYIPRSTEVFIGVSKARLVSG